MERNREPMDKNWIRGAAEQGERAAYREALVVNATFGAGNQAAIDCTLRYLPPNAP